MKLGIEEQTSLVLQQAQANSFVRIYPKFSLVLSTKHLAHFPCLRQPIAKYISEDPSRFMKISEALEIYVKMQLDNPKNGKQDMDKMSMKIMYWKIRDILPMTKFISLKYAKSSGA